MTAIMDNDATVVYNPQWWKMHPCTKRRSETMRLRTALQASTLAIFLILCAAGTYAADATTAIPRDQLSAACRNAKAAFHPLDQADVAQAKTVLVEALGRLDQRLAQAGDGGDAWRKYLEWDALQQSLAGDKKPDLASLTGIHARYAAGYEGLDLVWFLDVQHALHNYIATIGGVNAPGLRALYEKKLDALAGNLDAYLTKPTVENALEINAAVRFLQDAHQAPDLVKAIQTHLVQPNVVGEVSADFIAAGIAEPVDDVTHVSDCILGTSVVGTAHTCGKTSVSLSPDSDRGVIDMLFSGTTTSDNVGYHSPVTIFSTSTISLTATKRLWINEGGLFSEPATSNAETNVSINDIQSNKGSGLIEHMAWKRAAKQKSKAECIASSHAEQRLNDRIDAQAASQLEKVNKQFIEKYKRPFTERSLYPELLRFNTTAKAVALVAMQAGRGKLAAPGAAPAVVEGADVSIRLHESAVNNLAFDALAGRTIHEEKVQEAVTDALGHLPEKMQGDDDGKPWAITFAAQQPISVNFADNGFKVTIRGVKYYKGNEAYPAMNVSAFYKIEKSPKGFKAVRQGEIEVLPPGFKPGSGERIDAKRTIIRKLLSKRFAKVFEPEILGEGFEMSGKWKAAGKLVPIQVECHDGWLVIAWKRAAVESKVAKVR
jgi:hypothetical protein